MSSAAAGRDSSELFNVSTMFSKDKVGHNGETGEIQGLAQFLLANHLADEHHDDITRVTEAYG